MTDTDYPFTEAEMERAFAEWGCNCGPSALAFALRTSLDVVRPAIPGFEDKGHTTPTMMKAALANLGVAYKPSRDLSKAGMCASKALVRVQWTGTMTAPGANPRSAYRHTHWIVAWHEPSICRGMVFDCNGGIRTVEDWERTIVPALTGQDKERDGGWRPTHVWRVIGEWRR